MTNALLNTALILFCALLAIKLLGVIAYVALSAVDSFQKTRIRREVERFCKKQAKEKSEE